MIEKAMKPFRQSLIASLFLLMCLPLSSQTISGSYTYLPDEQTLVRLLEELKNRTNMAEVRGLFFRDTHDEQLVDLIVFIDERNPEPGCSIQLIKNGKKREHLYGERFVYAMVFVASDRIGDRSLLIDRRKWKKPNVLQISSPEKYWIDQKALEPSQFPIKDSLNVHISSLAQSSNSGEFALFSIAQVLTATLSSQFFSNDQDSETSRSTDRKAKLVRLGKTGDTTLYLAFVKLPVQVNSISRVRIGDPQDVYVYQATFGNYSAARLTSSVGFLASFDPETQSPDSLERTGVSYPSLTPFLFGHLYFIRPRIPAPRYNQMGKVFWSSVSLSLVFGTNVLDDLMSDLFIGGCVSLGSSKIGILFGLNYKELDYRNPEGEVVKSRREMHGSIGVSYIF